MVVYEILDSRQIKSLLLKKLAAEWRDDPSGPADLSLIRRCMWTIKVLKLKQIELARDVVSDGNFMRRLERRVRRQSRMIQEGRPVLPLVVTGKSHLLVDGYARYFGLKKLGVREAIAYSGVEKATSSHRI